MIQSGITPSCSSPRADEKFSITKDDLLSLKQLAQGQWQEFWLIWTVQNGKGVVKRWNVSLLNMFQRLVQPLQTAGSHHRAWISEQTAKHPVKLDEL